MCRNIKRLIEKSIVIKVLRKHENSNALFCFKKKCKLNNYARPPPKMHL